MRLPWSRSEEQSSDGRLFLLKDNGLFDKVLFEALAGKADKNGDGIVTLGEVIDYLEERMAQLSSVQHPVFSNAALQAKDLPLAKVGVSAGGASPLASTLMLAYPAYAPAIYK